MKKLLIAGVALIALSTAAVAQNGSPISIPGITQLTGDVTAGPGGGSKSSTVAAIQGKTVSGTTGTANVVFSASPTLSGIVTGPDAGTWSSTGIGTTQVTTSIVTTPSGDLTLATSTSTGLSIKNTAGGRYVIVTPAPNTSGQMPLISSSGGNLLLGTGTTGALSVQGVGSDYGLVQSGSSGATFTSTAGTTIFTSSTGVVTLGTAGALTTAAGGFSAAQGMIHAARVVTAAGAVTVTTADYTVVVNKTVGAATTVNLPAGVTGQVFVIKDGKGDAATNNITITPAAGNIDGASTYVINTNYGAVMIQYDGTKWEII